MDSLWDDLVALVSNSSRVAAQGHRSSVRTFFRFLDGYEKAFGCRIETLGDVTDAVGVLWLRPPHDGGWESPTANAYTFCRRLIAQAKAEAGVPFWWPPAPDRPPTLAHTASASEAKLLLHELKRRVQATYKRWDRCDALAATGRVLLPVPSDKSTATFVPTEADLHATYRAFIASSGSPLPTRRDLLRAMNVISDRDRWPRAWPIRFDELISAVYPTTSDLCAFLALFLARSGWNPATALALDITNEQWAVRTGTDDAPLWWIQSFKERSNSWQDTISPARLTTGCYQLVRALIDRTKALRQWVRDDPSQCELPELALKSPWIGISEAFSKSVVVLSRTDRLNREIADATQSANQRQEDTWARANESRDPCAVATDRPPLVPSGISASDFRDIFAGFVFKESRYAWTLAQWALGHRSPSTTRRYLRSRAWREQTRDSLSRFGTLVFDEIEVHKRLDPVLVKARAAGHDLEPAQVERLQAWRKRTYVGMGCQNPTMPDPGVDPQNPRDGTSACINTFRCATCSQGVVFDDSLDFLARRIAELRWLQRQSPLATWAGSSHETDLAILLATVSQWSTVEVEERTSYWEGRLARGEHRAIRFGGARR